jgi:tight adherence protein C
MALLNRRARLRLDRIDSEIPELVDLLLVGVEGGMGFNGAIRASSHRIEGPLGDELRLMLQQQSLGASSVESLDNLLKRCDTPAVHSLVKTIVQGERLGVSIGQLMRALAEEMRKRRKAAAEERAGKVPVKILFPLVFTILPAMFIILLTPAFANIVNEFNSI